MNMNPGIILAGQTPDIMGNFSRGMEIRAQENALAQQNDLANLYRTQGAQILAGDQQALNALAGFDPMAALNVQSTQQGMRMREEELAMTKENARLRGMELVSQMDARQAAEASAAVDRAIAMGTQAKTPQEWDAIMSQLGEEGAQFIGRFAERDMIVAGALGLSEALKMGQGPAPTADMIEFQYAQENPEFAQYQTDQKKAGASNTTVSVGLPGEEPPAGDALRASITDADTMLSMIESIDKNPALPKVTGAIEGGGGNNVDDFNVIQRGWYGDDGLALIQEIGQLQGNAWLGARALLKGGGQITDYESKKAEGAMARLSRAQGTKEFKAALKDLQDALVSGLEKLKAAQGGETPATESATGEVSISTDEEYDALPSGTVFVGPDGVKRRKP